MTCELCERYREWLREEVGQPVFDPTAAGALTPSMEVRIAWEEEGCEPCLTDDGWITACDFLMLLCEDGDPDNPMVTDFLGQLAYEQSELCAEDDAREEADLLKA